jgi:hypothetical protein
MRARCEQAESEAQAGGSAPSGRKELSYEVEHVEWWAWWLAMLVGDRHLDAGAIHQQEHAIPN